MVKKGTLEADVLLGGVGGGTVSASIPRHVLAVNCQDVATTADIPHKPARKRLNASGRGSTSRAAVLTSESRDGLRGREKMEEETGDRPRGEGRLLESPVTFKSNMHSLRSVVCQ